MSTKKKCSQKIRWDTWISKKATDEQQNKSITDRVTRENHVIDWNGVKVVGHETDHRTRWIKEAVAIHKHKGRAMNRDIKSYFLLSTYNKLLLLDSAWFHQNDTSRRRVDTFLRKTSADIETSIWIIKVRNSISFIIMSILQPIILSKSLCYISAHTSEL